MLQFNLLHHLSIYLTTIYTFKILRYQTLKTPGVMDAYGRHLNVEKGKTLPNSILNIKLYNDDGEETSLKSILAGISRNYRGIVLFIYPMANTPGCTKQACDFKDNFNIINSKGFLIFGISPDSPKSQKKWKNKHNLPYTLLCDQNKELITALNCRKLVLFTSRSHVIIDKNGTLLEIERDVSASESVSKCVKLIDEM